MDFSRTHALPVLCALTLASPLGALAAEQVPAPAAETISSPALDEVVVTAQRRQQNLQDVPLAVSSFSPQMLDAQQITNTIDVARSVPNFVASHNVGIGSANVYYIRGLGQTESFPTFEPQVGTYVDDIYIGRQNANNFSLFGLEQLQVLRGPQGTLFGRNSTGGAVVVTLAKPASTFGGEFEAGYGAYGQVFGHGSVDAPISDALLTRFSVFVINDDGYVKNLTTGRSMNKTKDYGVREAIRVLAADNITWDASVDWTDNDAPSVLNQPTGGGVHGSDRTSYSGLADTGTALATFLTGAKGRLNESVDVRTYGAMSNLKIDFSAGTLNVISGFRGMKQLLAVDFPDTAFGPAVPYDQSPVGQFALAQDLKTEQYSQEFKWTGAWGDRLTYTGGAFYLYEKNHDDYGAVANLGGLFGVPYFPYFLGDETTVNDTRSAALYAQGDYKFTDALTLTVGARYTDERKSLEASPNTAAAGAGFTTAQIQAQGYSTNLTAREFTPRAALQYKVDADLMFYASATRGFQGGGWNGLAFNAATFNDFRPETVWSYESGMRSEWLEHRVRFNANVFYEDVKSYQLLSDNTAAATFVTTNAADMFAYGLETELTWRPIDPLNLALNVGVIDAEYYNPSAAVLAQQVACKAGTASSCGSGIVDAFGNLATPSQTPHANASLHAQYELRVGTLTVTPNLGVQWTGSQNVGTEGSAAGKDNPFTTLDAGVSVKPASLPLTVTVECKNCTMKDYGTAYLFGYKYYNSPGFWDARVNYKF